MSKSTAIVIPFRSARSQKIDLALALAVLSKGVRAHERARRARLALLARSFLQVVDGHSHAKSLGA